jgi:hypothetical protein
MKCLIRIKSTMREQLGFTLETDTKTESTWILAIKHGRAGLRELVQFRIGAMGGSIAAGTWELPYK